MKTIGEGVIFSVEVTEQNEEMSRIGLRLENCDEETFIHTDTSVARILAKHLGKRCRILFSLDEGAG